MFKGLCSLFLFISLSAFSSESADLLSINQKIQILKSIDSICADSWCEGNFDYQFNDFSCNLSSNSCLLSFNFINEANNIKVKSPFQFCYFDRVRDSNQLMDNNYNLTR